MSEQSPSPQPEAQAQETLRALDKVLTINSPIQTDKGQYFLRPETDESKRQEFTVNQVKQATKTFVLEGDQKKETNLPDFIREKFHDIVQKAFSRDQLIELGIDSSSLSKLTCEQKIKIYQVLVNEGAKTTFAQLLRNFGIGNIPSEKWIIASIQAAAIEETKEFFSTLSKTEEQVEETWRRTDPRRSQIYTTIREEAFSDETIVGLTGEDMNIYDTELDLDLDSKTEGRLKISVNGIALILQSALEQSPDPKIKKYAHNLLQRIEAKYSKESPLTKRFVELYTKKLNGETLSADDEKFLNYQLNIAGWGTREDHFLSEINQKYSAKSEGKEKPFGPARLQTTVRQDFMAARALIETFIPPDLLIEVMKTPGERDKFSLSQKRITFYKALMYAFGVKPEKSILTFTDEEKALGERIKQRRSEVIEYVDYTGKKRVSTRESMNIIDANRLATIELLSQAGLPEEVIKIFHNKPQTWDELNKFWQLKTTEQSEGMTKKTQRYLTRDDIIVFLNSYGIDTDKINSSLLSQTTTIINQALTQETYLKDEETRIRITFKDLTGTWPESLIIKSFRNQGLKGIEYFYRISQGEKELKRKTIEKKIPFQEPKITMLIEEQKPDVSRIEQIQDLLKKLTGLSPTAAANEAVSEPPPKKTVTPIVEEPVQETPQERLNRLTTFDPKVIESDNKKAEKIREELKSKPHDEEQGKRVSLKRLKKELEAAIKEKSLLLSHFDLDDFALSASDEEYEEYTQALKYQDEIIINLKKTIESKQKLENLNREKRNLDALEEKGRLRQLVTGLKEKDSQQTAQRDWEQIQKIELPNGVLETTQKILKELHRRGIFRSDIVRFNRFADQIAQQLEQNLGWDKDIHPQNVEAVKRALFYNVIVNTPNTPVESPTAAAAASPVVETPSPEAAQPPAAAAGSPVVEVPAETPTGQITGQTSVVETPKAEVVAQQAEPPTEPAAQAASTLTEKAAPAATGAEVAISPTETLSDEEQLRTNFIEYFGLQPNEVITNLEFRNITDKLLAIASVKNYRDLEVRGGSKVYVAEVSMKGSVYLYDFSQSCIVVKDRGYAAATGNSTNTFIVENGGNASVFYNSTNTFIVENGGEAVVFGDSTNTFIVKNVGEVNVFNPTTNLLLSIEPNGLIIIENKEPILFVINRAQVQRNIEFVNEASSSQVFEIGELPTKDNSDNFAFEVGGRKFVVVEGVNGDGDKAYAVFERKEKDGKVEYVLVDGRKAEDTKTLLERLKEKTKTKENPRGLIFTENQIINNAISLMTKVEVVSTQEPQPPAAKPEAPIVEPAAPIEALAGEVPAAGGATVELTPPPSPIDQLINGAELNDEIIGTITSGEIEQLVREIIDPNCPSERVKKLGEVVSQLLAYDIVPNISAGGAYNPSPIKRLREEIVDTFNLYQKDRPELLIRLLEAEPILVNQFARVIDSYQIYIKFTNDENKKVDFEEKIAKIKALLQSIPDDLRTKLLVDESLTPEAKALIQKPKPKTFQRDQLPSPEQLGRKPPQTEANPPLKTQTTESQGDRLSGVKKQVGQGVSTAVQGVKTTAQRVQERVLGVLGRLKTRTVAGTSTEPQPPEAEVVVAPAEEPAPGQPAAQPKTSDESPTLSPIAGTDTQL